MGHIRRTMSSECYSSKANMQGPGSATEKGRTRTSHFVDAQRDVWGESAGKIWGAFAGIFGPDRLNNRWEVGAKSLKIMAMVGDSGAEKPCLKGDVPPVFLLNCVCDFIRGKHYSPRTEQPYLDWIKRFIHIHGKPHPPEVEVCLWHLDRMFD